MSAATETPQPSQLSMIQTTESGALAPANHGELMRVCEQIAMAKLCPDHLRGSKGDVFLVYQLSEAIGINPWVGVQNAYVVHGKVAWPGEILLALIQGHPICEFYNYGWTGTVKDGTRECWIQSKRRDRDEPNPKLSYSLDQAKQAGLYPSPGNAWSKYTDDMLMWKVVARDSKYNWGFLTKRALIWEDVRDGEIIDVGPSRAQNPAQVQPGNSGDPALAALRGKAEPVTIDLGAETKVEAPASIAKPELVAPEPKKDPVAPIEPVDVTAEKVCGQCGKAVKRSAVLVGKEWFHKSHQPQGVVTLPDDENDTPTVGVGGPEADTTNHEGAAGAQGEESRPPATEPTVTEPYIQHCEACQTTHDLNEDCPDPAMEEGEIAEPDAFGADTPPRSGLSLDTFTRVQEALRARAIRFPDPAKAAKSLAERACDLGGLTPPWSAEDLQRLDEKKAESCIRWFANADVKS